MGQSAINPSSYIIGQDSVNPEAGTLLVGSALFVNGDPTTVELTTLSQNELTYTLTVVNARDVFGNHLAPPELLVNPSTALFPGTPFSCSGLSHCNNGQGGTDGNGLCGSDHDCDDDPPCEEDEQDCVASCVLDPCNQPDFDLDGLPDDEEQRGWEMAVPPNPKPSEFVLYLGCNVLRTVNLAESVVEILRHLGVDFTAVGGAANCCGIVHEQNEAGEAGGMNLVSLVAWGGVGKSSLTHRLARRNGEGGLWRRGARLRLVVP